MDSDRFLIAVVDDDISFREALVSLLASFGYQTVAFASPKAYLDARPSPSPACLILDVRMPGMSGLELQSRLAARHQKPPVIFITSFADERTRSEALAAGAIAVFSKLDDRDDLVQAIRSALSQSPADPIN